MRQFDFSAADDELETEPDTLTYAQTEALARSNSLGNTETAPTLRGLESRGGDIGDGASQEGLRALD